ncbi:2Fe-2S iron-sulfur cluster-binding protein [Rhodopseudomonas sp. BR0M22]|uniref:2Fe-2S iron-sulfur cluster-binding protein n=1 Tax=Rhodopseudomonas sp. BR0M22 TaxID=2269369 RepID=UPI0013DF4797|nr:2Fe-2S iron-sulfur cluster-binding protein [Rhodopseudomonas sp. BR0M22]NEW90999.1 CDP-6-deoxy-delta-3,4-glucoseen reductase [Rhodopseudomonas sp. BR0M22]
MQVVLIPSGKSFSCKSGETILAAAKRQAINLASACENGTCGACKSEVVAGVVDHDDRASALTRTDLALGKALLCCAYARSDLTIKATQIAQRNDQPAATVPARVVRLQRLSPSVSGLTLRFPPGLSPAFRPGQFVGIEWEGRLRSFSIANAPRADGTIDLHIGRVQNGQFTGHVFEALTEGEILRLAGPFGDFGIADDQRPMLFVAGGTGMAPIVGMLQALAPAAPRQPIRLYWGCRNAREFYASNQVDEVAPAFADFRCVQVVSDDDPQWRGRSGFVHDIVRSDVPDLCQFDVYACGNPLLVRAMEDVAIEGGVPPARFFADSFNLVPPPAVDAQVLNKGATA